MVGAVTGRDVLKNSVLIMRCFGARCYLRCLTALVLRRQTTFLDCACKAARS